MSIADPVRSRLATQQAELVSALLTDGAPPAGFDGGRLRVAAASLAHKRAAAVARAWPALASALGERFGDQFAAFAQTMPLPLEGGPLCDGRRFAEWLAAKGELPQAGHVQAAAIDLRYASSPVGLVARRGPRLRLLRLKRPRRLLIAVRLPWLGEYWLSLPLGL